jgi:RHS repeat-associated protein
LTNTRHRFSFFYQSASAVDAFSCPSQDRFDDFTLTHTKSPVIQAEDYYPFGLAMDGNTYTDPYRYGYQGQYSEKDNLTGLNEFELRMYDARFGRWISPDPYGQYFSPYVGMGNSPVIRMDPDGGLDMPTIEIPGLTITGSRISTATTAIKSALSSLGRIALTDWYVPAGTKGYTKDAEWFKDNPGSGWEWIGNDDHQFLTESLLLSDLEFSSGMSKKGADLMRAGRIMGIYQAQEDFIQNDITQATIFAAGLLTGGSEAILLARVGRMLKPASKLIRPLTKSSSNLLGKIGEKSVPAVDKIKKSITIHGRVRIPDGLNTTTLSEVKNVTKLSFTRQLRDFHDYVKLHPNMSMDLYVRPSTKLSGSLLESGINIKFIW